MSALFVQLLLLVLLAGIVAALVAASRAAKRRSTPTYLAGGSPMLLGGKRVALVGALVGAAIGVLIVRGLMLDTTEEFLWRVFWHGLFEGRLRESDLEIVFRSSAFAKVLAGLALGGVAGCITATKWARRQGSR